MAPMKCNKSDIQAMDILCGKDKHCTDHIGSIAYKAILELRVPEYMDPKTEICDKTFMTVEMIETVMSEGGRFLRETKKGSGVWVVLRRPAAREKVRDGFRDAVKSARKTGTCTSSFLKKIGFSLQVTKETSFADLVAKISRDPAMREFLNRSKQRQNAIERTKTRRNSIVASRRSSLPSSLSSCTGDARVDASIHVPHFSPRGVVSNHLVPIMPLQFTAVPLSDHHQGTPCISRETPQPPNCVNLISSSDLGQKRNQSIPQPTFSDGAPCTATCIDDCLLQIPMIDDPWGAGDFEKEADPNGADDLLESLERADKLMNSSDILEEADSDRRRGSVQGNEGGWLDSLLDDMTESNRLYSRKTANWSCLMPKQQQSLPPLSILSITNPFSTTDPAHN